MTPRGTFVHMSSATPARHLQGTGGGLAAREQALAQREAEIRRKEIALARRGAAGIDPMLIKNFPPCCPVAHHDITNDIPDFNKNIMRACASPLCAP